MGWRGGRRNDEPRAAADGRRSDPLDGGEPLRFRRGPLRPSSPDRVGCPASGRAEVRVVERSSSAARAGSARGGSGAFTLTRCGWSHTYGVGTMFTNLRNRLFVILILIVGSGFFLYQNVRKTAKPDKPGTPLNLGLDLQGGMHLALELDQAKRVS